MFTERIYIRHIFEALRSCYEDCFPVWEMSNYSGKDFNLPVNIWIDGPRRLKHSKRIKIQNNYSEKFQDEDLLSMTLSDEPRLTKVFKKIRIRDRDLEQIKHWIVLNKDVLLEYSEGMMSTAELDRRLKPLI